MTKISKNSVIPFKQQEEIQKVNKNPKNDSLHESEFGSQNDHLVETNEHSKRKTFFSKNFLDSEWSSHVISQRLYMECLKQEFELSMGTVDPLKILLHQNCPKCDPRFKIIIDETRSHSALLSKQITWTWDDETKSKGHFVITR